MSFRPLGPEGGCKDTGSCPTSVNKCLLESLILNVIAKSPSVPILLTGGTGYIGGRLLANLLSAGHRVRCLCRDPSVLRQGEDTNCEVIAGDVLAPDTLSAALANVETAYYLIHSMGDRGKFEELEARAASNFAHAARAAGVKRIIYLGGLCRDEDSLSAHMRSRAAVGALLRESNAIVVELRASIVIGSGSLSYQLIASLVRRLPVMITPRWVRVAAQPIAIEDLVEILQRCAHRAFDDSEIIEIGGPDVVRYEDLLQTYSRLTGRKRLLIPVPLLTPWLSSLWLGLVTPLYARVGRKLIDSMRHPSVATANRAPELLGRPLMTLEQAVLRALDNEGHLAPQTRWLDSHTAGGTSLPESDEKWRIPLSDDRSIELDIRPEDAFAPIQRIGGETGWYYGNWLWTLRGWMDLLVGGVGMRRGRAHPDMLAVGDVLDFWRVESYSPNSYLRLRAEMKVPGIAWLEFHVTETESGSRIRQKATFHADPLAGRLYWYAVAPLHQFVFGGMLRNVARAGQRQADV
ncbi:MAG TPA: DUF2867 domain-containing protein [Lentisphaeria bacterium]|nr:DUF2867 domain-containing protein [Lentisphaeria bacterium]